MTDTSFISVHDNPLKHHFEAESHGEIAVAVYSLADGVITFLHTIVPESLRGRGVAKQLVLAGLASARQRGLRIIPKCPVFAAYMREHPETHDLLAQEGRTLLGI